MSDRILVEKVGHIAWMTLNRPEKLNAMTIDGWREMGAIIRELDKDLDIRCLVITGAGRSFLAGHDVSEIREHAEMISSGEVSAIQIEEWHKHMQESTRILRQVRFPVIAAVRGYAVGAGCELIFACDMIVSEPDGQFGFPEANIGATITNGGTFYLPRKVGISKAREMAYTGEFIDAKEAYRLGLVNRVTEPGALEEETRELAERIVTRSPSSVQKHKAMLDQSLESSLETMLRFETESQLLMCFSSESKEGTSAFLEKRDAKF